MTNDVRCDGNKLWISTSEERGDIASSNAERDKCVTWHKRMEKYCQLVEIEKRRRRSEVFTTIATTIDRMNYYLLLYFAVFGSLSNVIDCLCVFYFALPLCLRTIAITAANVSAAAAATVIVVVIDLFERNGKEKRVAHLNDINCLVWIKNAAKVTATGEGKLWCATIGAVTTMKTSTTMLGNA